MKNMLVGDVRPSEVEEYDEGSTKVIPPTSSFMIKTYLA